MGQRGRLLIVGTVALCGVVLLMLGIGGLRELLVIGKVPPELLGRRVGSTVGSLGLGLGLVVWCLVAGLGWARGGQEGTAGGEKTRSEIE